MSRLLNKPIKAFTAYALVILGLSIPAYYKVVDQIWLAELDEQNEILKENIQHGLEQYQVDDERLEQVLDLWSKIQPWTSILPVSASEARKPDSVYAVIRENRLDADDGVDRFRGLSSYITANGRHYHLMIETNVEEADEAMLAIAAVAILFFVLLVSGFILLNRRISKRIWKPFRSTLEQLKAYDLTSGAALPLEKTGIQEFEELHDALDKLIDRNVRAYQQQKAFIENASHELQTPLALLKSKLDLLMQNKDVTQAQAEILAAIELPLSRVARINKNLLLLAKIENHQFAEREDMDLSHVLHESMELVADYLEDKRLNITLLVQQPLHLSCNKFLLETLVGNLLTNAIRHSAAGSSIAIHSSANTLTFKNAGTQPLKRENLFERFSISSPETTNSGLGLAIVKEICTRYAWGISYGYEDSLHSFEVTFP